MTPDKTPTDAELEALLVESAPILGAIGDRVRASMVSAMRVAFAKWGTPAGAGEPVAVIEFTDGVKEPRIMSWNDLPPGQHRVFTTPQPTQAQAGAVPLTFEQARAIREGELNASSEGYFGARSKLDTNRNHNLFKAGFERGWDAREDLYAKE